MIPRNRIPQTIYQEQPSPPSTEAQQTAVATETITTATASLSLTEESSSEESFPLEEGACGGAENIEYSSSEDESLSLEELLKEYETCEKDLEEVKKQILESAKNQSDIRQYRILTIQKEELKEELKALFGEIFTKMKEDSPDLKRVNTKMFSHPYLLILVKNAELSSKMKTYIPDNNIINQKGRVIKRALEHLKILECLSKQSTPSPLRRTKSAPTLTNYSSTEKDRETSSETKPIARRKISFNPLVNAQNFSSDEEANTVKRNHVDKIVILRR